MCLSPDMDPITIKLPKTTPGVAELTGEWEDGGVYSVEVTQVSSDDKSVTLQFSTETPEETPAEAPQMPAPKMKAPYKA